VTTALNQLGFAGAFALQWGIGVALETLGRRGVLHAYELTFGAIWLLQMAGVCWSAFAPRQGTKMSRISSASGPLE
jgi:hypothetical protein